MKKEIVDGSTVYSEIYTDEDGYDWNLLRRADGSISIYATTTDGNNHAVIFDALDYAPPYPSARLVIEKLVDLSGFGAEAARALGQEAILRGDKVDAKNKVPAQTLEIYEQMDARLVMVELLKNYGLASFSDTRFIPLHRLVDQALVQYGLNHSKTNEKFVAYHLVRKYRRELAYEIGGAIGRETVKMPLDVFEEIERYEAEWRRRLGK